MLQTYSHGQHIEERLRVRLQSMGCQADFGEVLDHKYKLDFVINSFDGIGKRRPIGVQVTTDPGNRGKMEEFLRIQKEHSYVDKTLYIELQHQGIEAGVDRLVYSSILLFLFGAAYSKIAVGFLRIRTDFVAELMDLEDAIAQVPAQSQPPPRVPRKPAVPTQPAQAEPPVGTELTGTVRKFCRKGFGFIESDGLMFYFHLSNIGEDALREEMRGITNQPLMWVGLNIPVRFVCGERRDPKADHPTADKVIRVSVG